MIYLMSASQNIVIHNIEQANINVIAIGTMLIATAVRNHAER